MNRIVRFFDRRLADGAPDRRLQTHSAGLFGDVHPYQYTNLVDAVLGVIEPVGPSRCPVRGPLASRMWTT